MANQQVSAAYGPENIGMIHAPDPVTEPVKLDGRQKRGLKRRLALVAAARELFMQHGYQRTTLGAIIGRAGGSREMIYSYFGGKAGLLGAIITAAGERLGTTFLDEQLADLPPPREALTALGLRLVNVWSTAEGNAINRMVLSEGLNTPEILEAWYRSGPEPFLSALARYVEAQNRSGNLAVADPALLARQFQMLLMGEMAFPAISNDFTPFKPALAVERCVDLLMKAYAPREAQLES